MHNFIAYVRGVSKIGDAGAPRLGVGSVANPYKHAPSYLCDRVKFGRCKSNAN